MPRLISVALVLALVSPPSAAWALDPYELYAKKLELAEDATRRGDTAVAIEAYVVAYESLPGSDRATPLGADVVDRVNRLAQETFLEGSKDTQMLEQTRNLLEAHIRDLKRFSPETDVAPYTEKKRRIEAALATLDPQSPPPAGEPVPEPERDRSSEEPSAEGPSPTDDEVAVDRAEPRTGRSKTWTMGVGLTAGGVVLIAGGAGLLGGGAYMLGTHIPDGLAESEAKCAVEISEGEYSTLDECFTASKTYEWEDGEKRKGYAYYGLGAVVLAAGIAMTATGTVFLVRDRKGRTVARLLPAPASNGTGLALLGQF